MPDISPQDDLAGTHLISPRSPEREICLLVTGLLIGSLAMLCWEWTARHRFQIATVPVSRQERLLIVLQSGIWLTFCAAATTLLFANDWYDRIALRVPERLRMYLGPATWLFGVTAVISLARGAGVALPMSVGAVLFLGYRASVHRLDLLSRNGLVPLFAVGLWALSINPRYTDAPAPLELWSGAFAALGLTITAVVLKWKSPAATLAGVLECLALVAVLALELPRFNDYPFLLLGTTAYFTAVPLGRTGGKGLQEAGRCWIAVVAAASLLPLCARLTDPLYLTMSVVAGSAVAMLVHAVVSTFDAFPLKRLPSRGVGLLGLVVAAGVAWIVPLSSTVVFGTGLGLWDRLFPQPSPELDPEGEPTPIRDAWLVGLLMVLSIVARIVFWVVTDRVWEDALITIRHAENAVAGRGLTHHPAHGLVHGFTSPLSVLVPLLGEWIHPGSALVTIRVASLLAGAATVWLAGKVANHPEVNLSTPAKLFWLSYLAFEHSQIAFGMAGMETQIWTCVLIGGVAALLYGRPLWLALALSLSALSRPEGVVWIGIALAGWLWQHGWKRFVLVVGLTVAGIVPWIGFTTFYYGSPVPNTIRAKSVGYLYNTAVAIKHSSFLAYVASELEINMGYLESLLPPHFVGHGLAPIPTVPVPGQVAALLIWLGSSGFIALVRPRSWPVPLFVAGITVYFVLVVQVIFNWYPPPILGLGALLVASGIDSVCRVFRQHRNGVTTWSLGIGLAALFVLPLPYTYASERLVQRVLEDSVRARTGLWLRDHAGPDDYVTAECLGYLGYYSHLPFHDYPGLCSPRAVAALKTTGGRDRFLSPIVEILEPTWLVLRRRELGFATADYELVQTIESEPGEAEKLTRFLQVSTNDDAFFIFRRKTRPRRENPGSRGKAPS